MVRVAVVGCTHGQLDRVYADVTAHERSTGETVDLLLCPGDFEAVRDSQDLSEMAVPPKYRKFKDFIDYYTGRKVAPVLTIFVGGNHEAPIHLQELALGGWVAPNIFYLGRHGVVNVQGLRIGGLSGIYKSHDFKKGFFERRPLSEGTKRSMYHVREFSCTVLENLRYVHKEDSPVLDIFLSHDWPNQVEQFGDLDELLRRKPFFRQEVDQGCMGNPATRQLLDKLQPRYWFAAHLHVHFTATVHHEDTKAKTEFLALDKPEGPPGRRKYIDFLTIESGLCPTRAHSHDEQTAENQATQREYRIHCQDSEIAAVPKIPPMPSVLQQPPQIPVLLDASNHPMPEQPRGIPIGGYLPPAHGVEGLELHAPPNQWQPRPPAPFVPFRQSIPQPFRPPMGPVYPPYVPVSPAFAMDQRHISLHGQPIPGSSTFPSIIPKPEDSSGMTKRPKISVHLDPVWLAVLEAALPSMPLSERGGGCSPSLPAAGRIDHFLDLEKEGKLEYPDWNELPYRDTAGQRTYILNLMNLPTDALQLDKSLEAQVATAGEGMPSSIPVRFVWAKEETTSGGPPPLPPSGSTLQDDQPSFLERRQVNSDAGREEIDIDIRRLVGCDDQTCEANKKIGNSWDGTTLKEEDEDVPPVKRSRLVLPQPVMDKYPPPSNDEPNTKYQERSEFAPAEDSLPTQDHQPPLLQSSSFNIGTTGRPKLTLPPPVHQQGASAPVNLPVVTGSQKGALVASEAYSCEVKTEMAEHVEEFEGTAMESTEKSHEALIKSEGEPLHSRSLEAKTDSSLQSRWAHLWHKGHI